MWYIERIGVSDRLYKSPQDKDMIFVPCLRLNADTCFRFKHIWVRIRNYETGAQIEERGSALDYDRLLELLKGYSPYGLAAGLVSTVRDTTCILVSVDKPCIQFLDYVESVNLLLQQDSPVELSKMFTLVNTVYDKVDPEGTFYGDAMKNRSKWFFPLAHVAIHTPTAWVDDIYYVILLGSMFHPLKTCQVIFNDARAAKAHLTKMRFRYGYDPIEVGCRICHSMRL